MTTTATPLHGRRVRTPTVLQMEAVECGAAALAMVLAYHGRVVPLEELRVACGVSRDGSKANNIVRAARVYGLEAKGFKKEPGDLPAMSVPMIVHWNFNHFVVVEGFRRGRAYINDPAVGPLVISTAEFDRAFTGVALVFEPGPDFVREGELPTLVGALARRLPGSRAALLFIVLTGLALVIPGIAAPSYTRAFIDDILVRGMLDWGKPLLLLMIATAILIGCITWVQQHHLLRLESRLAIHSSGQFFWHVLRLPVTFFSQRYAGDIGNRVGINDRVARMVSGDLATATLNVLVVVFYAALLLRYDLLLATVAIVTATANIAALKYVSRRRADLSRRLMQDRGKLMGTGMSGLQTIETLKATGSESDFFSRWSGYQAKVSNAYQELQYTTSMLSLVPPLLLALNTALVLGLGGLRVIDGRLSMGLLIAFQTLVMMLMMPINRLVDLASMGQEVKGDLDRLDDVLHAQRDPSLDLPDDDVPRNGEAAAPGATESAKLTGRLELRGVSFGYSRLDPPLISELDLSLEPGSRVALVGGSGSGKSTVAKLVAGLYEPWSGEILFDGLPRQAVPRRVLTASLGVVDQDVSLFEDTIKENLTLWDATVPEADLVQAARDGCIHEEVTARAGGYTGHVEEGGRNFSGGQRQRLEIARALVSNPRILVLDEATSALDPTTEKSIDDQLRRRGCTCLIVAHRLSTIRDCDEIIILHKGKVVQRGTHRDMIDAPGPYRDLIALE